MAEQDNRRLARQAFDAWNAHDPERLAKLIDEKYIGRATRSQGRSAVCRACASS
jgi:nuclear transport factor 2 (NTF2) superfamily protein